MKDASTPNMAAGGGVACCWPARPAMAGGRGGGFIWDDNDYVTSNLNLRDGSAGLVRIWTDPHSDWQYYPLDFSTFWFEWQAWGNWAAGFHIDNILLHAVGAAVLWPRAGAIGFAGWRGMAGGGDLCGPSGAGRIGGVDQREKELFVRPVLFS